MVRFYTIIAAALACAASSQAATHQIKQGYSGFLDVVGNHQAGSHFNKTTTVHDDKLVIGEPALRWKLTVVQPAGQKRASVLIRSSRVSCLTAHKRTGPSYFYLDDCSDISKLKGSYLADLKARQWFDAEIEGSNVALVQHYPHQRYDDNRAVVRVVEKSQEVHLTTKAPRRKDKYRSLYFRFDPTHLG